MEDRKREVKRFKKNLIVAANILDSEEIDEEVLEILGEALVKVGVGLLELADNIRREKIINIAIRN